MSELTRASLLIWAEDMAKQTARAAVEIGQIYAVMDEEASEVRRTADQIGAMNIDPDTVSETKELSKIMQGLSESALAYCATATDTSKTAEYATSLTRANHDRIDEAVNRSPARNIHDVPREWLTQE